MRQEKISILGQRKRNEVQREKYVELERRYREKKKVINVAIEEFKQMLKAKTHKLKRYEQRSKQYRLNIFSNIRNEFIRNWMGKPCRMLMKAKGSRQTFGLRRSDTRQKQSH